MLNLSIYTQLECFFPKGLLWPPLYALLCQWMDRKKIFKISMWYLEVRHNFWLYISISLYILIIRKWALKFKSGQSNPGLRYPVFCVQYFLISFWIFNPIRCPNQNMKYLQETFEIVKFDFVRSKNVILLSPKKNFFSINYAKNFIDKGINVRRCKIMNSV